jgi:hypothetical protein
MLVLCLLPLILALPTNWQAGGFRLGRAQRGREGRSSLCSSSRKPCGGLERAVYSVDACHCCRTGSASLHERRLNNSLSFSSHLPQWTSTGRKAQDRELARHAPRSPQSRPRFVVAPPEDRRLTFWDGIFTARARRRRACRRDISTAHKGTARFPVLHAAQNGCELQLEGSLAHRAQWLQQLTRPCAALTGLQPFHIFNLSLMSWSLFAFMQHHLIERSNERRRNAVSAVQPQHPTPQR